MNLLIQHIIVPDQDGQNSNILFKSSPINGIEDAHYLNIKVALENLFITIPFISLIHIVNFS